MKWLRLFMVCGTPLCVSTSVASSASFAMAMVMATTATLLSRPQPSPLMLALLPPSLASSRCLHSGFSTSTSIRSNGGAQRQAFQVSATAAEQGSVPPPTPESNITPAASPAPPKPTMKKGQIVRVDKEKYLNSVETLQTSFFDHGEYALIAWAGIPTSPAWLPTYMLIKQSLFVPGASGHTVPASFGPMHMLYQLGHINGGIYNRPTSAI